MELILCGIFGKIFGIYQSLIGLQKINGWL
jgi:hypothetical protein